MPTDQNDFFDDLLFGALDTNLSEKEREALDLGKSPPQMHPEDKKALDTLGQDLAAQIVFGAREPLSIEHFLFINRRSQRVFHAETTSTVSEGGSHGLIVRANGLPSGDFDIEVVFRSDTLLRRKKLGSFNIPLALTDVPISSQALAGKTSDISAEEQSYILFRLRLSSTPSEAQFTGGLEGYIAPQEHGAGVELFFSFSAIESP